ncbi:HisA/HisF-related TIM barrel protein [Aquabacter sp. P-9]|uniref:HisA/HisF-related TIM barrel protein n=1 Tax=Aquabacter sediminis TaxID=3029197 RepID=UPI00237D8B85|nr:HisA/HisF-related TIM barrel protein [Aquabacter sp. P-9]MDE1567820.1 HisA/HisF-related TIM barrel protein [Aquabacter sp. P-9]
MQIIPVIDLKGGQVVHARRGLRHLYRPVQSRLAEGADPLVLTEALLALGGFRTLYVADLDAIAGTGDNAPVVAALRARFPALDVWVDAAEARLEALDARRAADLGTAVVGSESLSDVEALAGLAGRDFVLSLDRTAEGPLGPLAVHETPALWPSRLIAMTLARVGSGEGPDLSGIADLRARAPLAEIYAAGGVRGRADLDALVAAGAAGVLVATALHDGTLTAADLADFR